MKTIVLVGFMGCGKSTLGKILRDSTGFRLVDTDALIEEKEGCSIGKIFEEKGEKYFRELETEVLVELSKIKENLIISTGGGIVTRACNIPILKSLGRVVYLKLKPESAVKRLEGDRTRPLLMGEDKLIKVRELMEVREELYMETSDLVIETDDMDEYDVAREIEKTDCSIL